MFFQLVSMYDVLPQEGEKKGELEFWRELYYLLPSSYCLSASLIILIFSSHLLLILLRFTGAGAGLGFRAKWEGMVPVHQVAFRDWLYIGVAHARVADEKRENLLSAILDSNTLSQWR